MRPLLRVVRLLTMVVWVGGLCFFAFVLAPVAFHVLPSTHQAGLVVAGTLAVLHPMGLICGVLFLASTTALWMQAAKTGSPARRLLMAELWLVLLMMAATAYVQMTIVPAMERDRIAAGGDVDAAPDDNAARLDFERLHPLSEKVEGSALLLGFAVVVLLGMERA
jgi:uncharacterized membrane protein